MSEQTLLKRLDKINDLIFQHAEKNYQGNLDSGGEGRATGKREKKVEKLFKERKTVEQALKKLKASGNIRGGGSVSTGAGSLAPRRGIKKLMENL